MSLTDNASSNAVTEHSAFTLERIYDATPAQVFHAWADLSAKKRWFTGLESWGPPVHTLDFRVGGRETSATGPAEGPVHLYEAHYEDIVPDRRIILAYTMTLGAVRISASLLTIQFLPHASQQTRLILTEQLVVLDSRYPAAGREEGTRGLLEKLAVALA